MKNHSILFAVMLAVPSFAFAAGEGWSTDYEASKKEAAESKKDLLIDFTGSDWCGWCIKLKDEVFKHDPFNEGVKDKFVLVEIDFPRDKSNQSEELQEQNKNLGTKYAVQGYPTIMLTDAEGRPYASTGYQAGGPEKYVEHLVELQSRKVKRDEALAAADKAEGVEKAKALISALDSMGLESTAVSAFYGDVVESIKAADPEDSTGFSKKEAAKAKFAKFEKELQEYGMKQDMEGALGLVKKTLEEGGLEPEDAQKVTLTNAGIFAQQGKFDEALEVIESAKKIAPDSEIAGHLDGFKSRVEAMKAEAEAEGDGKE